MCVEASEAQSPNQVTGQGGKYFNCKETSNSVMSNMVTTV